MWGRTSNCSPLLIYRPWEDERLSWPGWLTNSGRLAHISGHPSATGRTQDGERTLARDWRSTAEPRGPQEMVLVLILVMNLCTQFTAYSLDCTPSVCSHCSTCNKHLSTVSSSQCRTVKPHQLQLSASYDVQWSVLSLSHFLSLSMSSYLFLSVCLSLTLCLLSANILTVFDFK